MVNISNRNSRLLYWAPRVLCILFAALLSLFSFDVFEEGYGFWKTIAALLMHLIPVFIVLLTLALAWRWEWIGAVVFIGLGLFYLVWFWGRFHWSAYVIISGTSALVGFMFLLNWVWRDKIRKARNG